MIISKRKNNNITIITIRHSMEGKLITFLAGIELLTY